MYSLINVLRRQLPAHSPLSLRAVLAGASGALHEPIGLRTTITEALCQAYSARQALLVGSGTSALQLALAGIAATVSRRPVALPAYSCYDVASAANGADVDVWVYDIDARTLGTRAMR